MATPNQNEQTQDRLPLEKALDFAPNLLGCLYLDSALKEIEADRENITEAEYQLNLALICSVVEQLAPFDPIEA